MRVLTIVNKLDMGGVEKTLLNCISYFNSRGIESHIMCKGKGKLENEFAKENTLLHNNNLSNIFIFKNFKLLYIILKYNIDVVHSRDGYTSGFLALICSLTNTPFIISIHNPKPMFLLRFKSIFILNFIRKIYLKLNKILSVKYANLIIGHSKNNLNYYQSDYYKNPDMFEIIYNGVNFNEMNSTKEFIENNTDKIRIIHIGSFKPSKNHNVLIKIFHKLILHDIDAELILCGDGETKDQVIDLVNNLKISNQVSFLGNVKDVSQELARSNLFIFPSLYEGFGNVLIEAQFMEVPIVASDIPAHREALHSSYHKYLFDLNDIEKAVSNCLEIIVNKKWISNDFIEPGKKFSKGFNVEIMAEKLIDCYKLVNLKK